MIVWNPRPDDLERSHVARFMRAHGIDDPEELRRRAADDPDWFYPAMIEDLGIEWYERWQTVRDVSKGFPWTEWFAGGKLNIVHNCLDRHLSTERADQTAVIAQNDAGDVTRLTYAELDVRVSRLAMGLRSLGVKANDAVGFYMPMSEDVVVGLLACLKIGAAAMPVFAGFGPEALATRIQDCGARVILTADGTTRRSKTVPLKGTADDAANRAGCVDHLVVLQRSKDEVDWDPSRDVWWHELEAAPGLEATGEGPLAPTEVLDASARSLLLYTSGTTGRPKGAVHSHAGVQIVTAKEVGYHLDVRGGETMFWLTDIGWMMGPWEILGVLFHGGTVVLLDGLPDHPGTDRVWSMVERHTISHLALAPTAVRVLMAHGDKPVRKHDVSSIRVFGSTGEPWDPSSYRWLFEVVGGSRCPIINISGGTEIMGCLLAPLPVAPLKAMSLQGPALGMATDVFDDRGQPVRGEVGYLVCRAPSPSMTRGFLDDPERYLETYFSRFGPEVWFHGDWALVDEDGHWFLTGRADDTLKIAGKRIGPSEVESAAVAVKGVREAAAVGLPDDVKGTKLVVVAVPADGYEPTSELADKVRRHIGAVMGPAMRPSRVIWAGALPVTRSGKILRGTIRKALLGEDPGSLASCANPESVDALRG